MDENEKIGGAELLQAWEKAYLEQYNDAAMGRMFRGIIHNLNGVIQTFTMQAELFAMMFEQAGGHLDKIIAASEGEVKEQALRLQQLLARRAPAIPQMEEKVAISRRLLTRATGLNDQFRREIPGDYTLNAVVENELEFLYADPFFKHKIVRTIDLAPAPPPLAKESPVLHQVLHAVLVNAIEALAGVEQPTVLVRTVPRGDHWELLVEDNGPGIAPGEVERIFLPGVTAKEGHAGLGLYLARKSLAALGGTITARSEPGRTRFVLAIPV